MTVAPLPSHPEEPRPPDSPLARAFAITGISSLLFAVLGLLFWRRSVPGADFEIGLCLLLAPLCTVGAVMVRAKEGDSRRADPGAVPPRTLVRQASPFAMVALMAVLAVSGPSSSTAVASVAGMALLLCVIVSLASAFESDYGGGRGNPSASQISGAASESATSSQPSSTTPGTDGTPSTRVPAATAAPTPGRESSSTTVSVG